jgi:nucleotide-binding universal stress UspA family protein
VFIRTLCFFLALTDYNNKHHVTAESHVDDLQDAKALLDAMELHLHSVNSCKITKTILNGDPKTQVIEYALQIKADYLLAGLHGRSGRMSGQIGSVGDYYVNHAAMPTMILRRFPYVPQYGVK